MTYNSLLTDTLLIKPIFKWAGSKNRVMDVYGHSFFPQFAKRTVDVSLPLVQTNYDTFVDLFCGSCATSLYMKQKKPHIKIVLNDVNTELITMYRILKNSPDNVIKHFVDISEQFISLSAEDRKKLYEELKNVYSFNYADYSPSYISAILIVLLKTCFNGIWKSYKKYNYRFSTPAGSMNFNSRIFDADKLKKFSQFLKECDIHNYSYENVPIQSNSYIYADPPYLDLTSQDPINYATVFGGVQQKDLINYLISTKHLFSLSNKEHDDFFKTIAEENGLFIDYFNIRHSATSKGENRQIVKEILLRNFEIMEFC